MRTNKNIYTPLGASNHTSKDREENDYYATHPSAVEHLLKLESFQTNILEPMCGEGHISKTLSEHGYNVTSFDIVDRGFGEVKDFLSYIPETYNFDIITNPPYKNVTDYVYKCLSLMQNKGQKTALFLRLLFLEGRARKVLFEKYPPVRVWVSSGRLPCAKNGEFEEFKAGTAMAFAWFIWEQGYQGETILKWFN